MYDKTEKMGTGDNGVLLFKYKHIFLSSFYICSVSWD